MTVQQQVAYLASWRHRSLCAQPSFRGPGAPPDHSWIDCPRMARFHWAARAVLQEERRRQRGAGSERTP